MRRNRILRQETRRARFHIEVAAESDWSWIIQGQMEIFWAGLDHERRRQTDRQIIEECVRRQIEHLREDEGFPNEAFVVRTDDGTLAGFVWVARTHNDSTGQLEASLISQYVAELYRGRGLGHCLMETAENWARQQGLPRISLSVGAHNVFGQRLYESLGYQVETLRMTKKLGAQEADHLFPTND